MIKLLLIFTLLTISLGLFAQTGLFNLSYALPFAEADSLLAISGFEERDSGNDMVRYYPLENELVTAIIVFVEPKTQRIVGWFIKYSSENTEENDNYVLQTLQKMHGEKNHYDEETQQLIWFLSTTRTVHVMYGGDNSLTVLYYDSYFPQLFRLEDHPKAVQPDEPEPEF